MKEVLEAKTERRASLGKLSTTSLTKMMVLSILEESSRELCGSDIRRILKSRLHTVWQPSDDLLYNLVLKDLAKHGLLLASREEGRSYPGWARTYYTITHKGRDLLVSDRVNKAYQIKDTQQLLCDAIEIIYKRDEL